MISADSDRACFTTANDGNGRDSDASDPGDFVTAGEAGTDSAATPSQQLAGTARRRSA